MRVSRIIVWQVVVGSQGRRKKSVSVPSPNKSYPACHIISQMVRAHLSIFIISLRALHVGIKKRKLSAAALQQPAAAGGAVIAAGSDNTTVRPPQAHSALVTAKKYFAGAYELDASAGDQKHRRISGDPLRKKACWSFAKGRRLCPEIYEWGGHGMIYIIRVPFFYRHLDEQAN